MGASHGTIPENTTTNTMITTTTTTGGAVKHPEPFQMVFPQVIGFFPLIIFRSADFTP